METPIDTQLTAPQETLQPVEQKYQQAMDQLVPIVPELHEKREAIDTASREIVETFDIQPEFFDDQGRSIVFGAISERWTHLKSETEDQGNDGERAFLYDCISLLARDFSPKLTEAKKLVDIRDSHVNEASRLAIYDKYTDETLSKAVTEKIKSGELLSEIKKRMGITVDNEDDYEVRAITAISDIMDTWGLRVPPLDLSDLEEQQRAEKQRLIKNPDLEPAEKERLEKNIAALNKQILEEIAENEILLDMTHQQRRGLEARGKKMAEEMGADELFGSAWVTRAGDKTLLCISMPLAEKLTSPELTGHTSGYSEKDFQEDVATLEHEYVHTQGGLNIDHDVFFGINLEELKAEHFSGDKHGYQDIKGFFVDYQTITGENPKEMFDKLLKGGTPQEIYASIAKRVGLARMLEVVMASPNNYIAGQGNQISKKAHEYLDGYDGIQHRLIEQEIAAGHEDELDERIEKRARIMHEVIGKDSGQEWLWDYKRKHGLNVVTDRVNMRAEELGLKQAA